MNIGDLFIQLGFKADTYKVKDFANAIKNMPLSVASAITALAGLDFGVVQLISHTLDVSNGLSLFRSETGLSTQQLQRLGNVARGVGLDSKVAESSIRGIANAVTQATRFGTGGAAQAFDWLGIQDFETADPFKINKELRARYKTLQTPGDKNFFASLLPQIGVNPEIMKTYDLSDKRYDALQNAGRPMNNADLTAMADLQAALARFSIEVEEDFVPVLTAIIPHLSDLADALKIIAVPIAKWVVKGVGEDAHLAKEMKRQGGPGSFLNNLFDYFIDPEGVGSDRPKPASGTRNIDQIIDQINKSNAPINAPSASTPVTNNMSVEQHIHGVTNGADADHVGAQHIKTELFRATQALQSSAQEQ